MRNIAKTFVLGTLVGLCIVLNLGAHAQDRLDRSVLPLPKPKRPLYTDLVFVLAVPRGSFGCSSNGGNGALTWPCRPGICD
jgi:hypothetical protein